MGAVRSKRFAMVVEDMKVTYIGVETQYVSLSLSSFQLSSPYVTLSPRTALSTLYRY